MKSMAIYELADFYFDECHRDKAEDEWNGLIYVGYGTTDAQVVPLPWCTNTSCTERCEVSTKAGAPIFSERSEKYVTAIGLSTYW